MSAGWSPLITIGQASLIVYWLHVDIVYGRLFHGFAQALDLSSTVLQFVWLVPVMLLVASAKPALAVSAVYDRAYSLYATKLARS
jgi:fucose 4-O-acetylase-like acetyltransferase